MPTPDPPFPVDLVLGIATLGLLWAGSWAVRRAASALVGLGGRWRRRRSPHAPPGPEAARPGQEAPP